MANSDRNVARYLNELIDEQGPDGVNERLAPKFHPLARRLPRNLKLLDQLIERRWKVLEGLEPHRDTLLDPQTRADQDCYAHNIENFIGTVKVPVGLAGPLRINGLFAQDDYLIPLATTEAALVASYHRGAQLITKAGGCSTLLLDEGVSRTPAFAFDTLREVSEFVAWVVTQQDYFTEVAQSTTRHGKLTEMRFSVEGNHVYLNFKYHTGDAAGQNMVTLATEAIFATIVAESPVVPRHAYLEANMSGDKKASAQSFQTVRGKKVTAEVVLSADLVRRGLHTTPEEMVKYGRVAISGSMLSGAMGVQGHYANALAALYIACGQDAACVSESAVGISRMEVTDDGGLYTSVTLPNLIVGTVGGGTGLPSQRACLDILGLAGNGKARAFAEVCAAIALAGEISLIAAICSGHFARAHRSLARGRGGSNAIDLRNERSRDLDSDLESDVESDVGSDVESDDGIPATEAEVGA